MRMREAYQAEELAKLPMPFTATKGDPAPLFTADAVIDQGIQKVSLQDFQGQWVLLFFYPSDFTFV
jgi:alkyl hydroperoxide reductase subunit AhpC